MARAPYTLVFPVYNEAANLPSVLRVALGTNAAEIIVVDDGSTDGTGSIVRAFAAHDPRIRGVRHAVNQGVGASRRDGIHAAEEGTVVFFDADITTLTPRVIESLYEPIASNEADFAIAAFENEGRVTELTAKPLLATCFPELSSLQQPISGQFAARRQFLFPDHIENAMLGILIDAHLHGARIVEVDIGVLEHGHRPLPVKQRQAIAECRACLRRYRERLAAPRETYALVDDRSEF